MIELGTEVGALLNKIYGREKKEINYPELKRSGKSSVPPPQFIPGGAPLLASDPRTNSKGKFKDKVDTMFVPKPKKSGTFF